MGLFGFGKKGKIIDYTEGYKIQQARAEQMKKAQQIQTPAQTSSNVINSNPFSFFDSPPVTSSGMSLTEEMNEAPDERKKKLARRIMDMTERMEDLSNQVYHLQQRVEVLERKANISRVD